MTTSLPYLAHYSPSIVQQISAMLERNQLGDWLRSKHQGIHSVANDNDLRDYVLDLKNHFLKKTAPLSKIAFDNKIHVVNQALGLHSYVARIQGNKIKRKNELRVSTLFKQTPELFLNMIVVHELAHLKEKDHNKAFYQLCQHMLPDYHQLEFEVRVYLTELEHSGKVW
jgi:UTP pyrophosphatase